MAKNLLFALVLAVALAGCGDPPAGPPPREAISSMYVNVPELRIYAKPDPTSEVLSTYRVGETVSVLADKGDWVEVRVGMEGSGWAEKKSLSTTREEGSTVDTPRFATPPNPVFSPNPVKGEIMLEADVNTDGDVTAVRTISNTTGNDALAAKNEEALKLAKFYPIMDHGKAKPFIYMHRVTY